MGKMLEFLYLLYTTMTAFNSPSIRPGFTPVVDRPPLQLSTKVSVSSALATVGRTPIIDRSSSGLITARERDSPTAAYGYTKSKKQVIVGYWVDMLYTIHGIYTRAIILDAKLSHLTEMHGLELGLGEDQRKPLDPNMKQKAYQAQMDRAKLSVQNKQFVLGVIDRILGLSTDEVEVFPEVQLRAGGNNPQNHRIAHVFREKSTGVVLAIYTDGPDELQVARLQPLSIGQLDRLKTQNKMD